MTMDGIEVFVEVVEARNFSRAADRLSMPATTVSAKVARLEERLGVTLIQRTTRQLYVTPIGRKYYEHCIRALAALDAGERELATASRDVAGHLRITAPRDFTQCLVTPLVERFLAAYPKTSIEMIVTSHVVDLIAEGVDLAVRARPQTDSSLQIQEFQTVRMRLWASRDYLERAGVPQTPDDLEKHELLRFSPIPMRFTLKTTAGVAREIDFKGRIVSDDFDVLKSFIQRGNGIGLLPEFSGVDQLPADGLVRVLPDYASDQTAICFAYPAQRFLPPTVHAFIAMALGENDKVELIDNT